MSLNTLPNYPRGVLILDPAYYTSSVFVEPMRKDIQGLLEDFVLVYSSSPPPRRVFSIFKDVWSSRGWEFLHLCAIDDVVRDTFLITVFRLFLGASLFNFRFRRVQRPDDLRRTIERN